MSMSEHYQQLERMKKHTNRLKENLQWLLPRLEGFEYTQPDYETMGWGDIAEENTIKLEELLIQAAEFDDANGGQNIYNGRFAQARDIADQLENGFWRWSYDMAGYQFSCRANND